MPQNNWPGKFIVLEGLDGSDTITYAGHLESWLKEKMPTKTIHLTREPSDGPIGRDIRLYLNGRLTIDKLTAAALFVADRMDHIYRAEDGILARLERGEYVICDRYYLSTYAYQPMEGVDIDWLYDLHEKCIHPDLTLFINLPVDQCLQRYYAERLQKTFHAALPGLDQEDIAQSRAKFETVYKYYQIAIEQLRDKQGERIELITKDVPESIERDVRRFVEKAFGPWG